MVVGLGVGNLNAASLRICVVFHSSFLRPGLKVEKHAFVGFRPRGKARPARVTCFKGKQPVVVEVRVHPLKQGRLIAAGELRKVKSPRKVTSLN